MSLATEDEKKCDDVLLGGGIGIGGDGNNDNCDKATVNHSSIAAPERVEGRRPASLPETTPTATTVNHPNRTMSSVANKRRRYGRPPTVAAGWLRLICLDLPYLITILLFWTAFIIRHLWQHYYVILSDRAARSNTDLHDEYTYYHRHCDAHDITVKKQQGSSSSTTIDTLWANNNNNNTSSVWSAQHIMMQHGVLLLPQVLPPHLVHDLRNYIVDRNHNITDDETYPVSQGYHRLSYGIDATEHVAVTQAVQHLTRHDLLLSPLLSTLLGDVNPASAEITAITNYVGCPQQAWHSDTKVDGNALHYARTFHTSYSIFIPLQDTTAHMGPTDVCVGTHYCSNDVHVMCEQHKLGLHETNASINYFRAGDAAILNQHVWHRGGAHVDAHAPERIVFIVSFLARPPPPPSPSWRHPADDDARQLARGTYFHQKYNMWGHTWWDLQNPHVWMRWPFSLGRCLGLFSSSGQWGYDLLTSVYLRFANGQLEHNDLPGRLVPRLLQLGLPAALLGTVLDDDDDTPQRHVWETFLHETIDNVASLCTRILVAATMVYGLVVTITVALTRRWFGRAPSEPAAAGGGLLRWTTAIRRLMVFQLVGAGVGGAVLLRIQTSPWGTAVQSGQLMMRPFPPVSIPRDDDVNFYGTGGPTTLPQRRDVLLGTRYDAAFLGAYDDWLQYHPGNRHFAALVQAAAGNAHDVASPVAARLVDYIIHGIVHDPWNGRILHQDHRTGDWRVLAGGGSDDDGDNDNDAVRTAVREELYAAQHGGRRRGLQRALQHALARARFGWGREMAMAQWSVRFLHDLRRTLLQPAYLVSSATTDNGVLGGAAAAGQPRALLAGPVVKTPNSTVATTPSEQSLATRLPVLAMLHDAVHDSYSVGTKVWCVQERLDDDELEEWWPGTIVEIHAYQDTVRVAYENGRTEPNVEYWRLHKYVPVVQGDNVMGCYDYEMYDCYPGTILRVHPSGQIAIEYDDGDVDFAVPPQLYYREPYRYRPDE